MEPNALMQVAAILIGLAASSHLLMAVMRVGGVPRTPNWLDAGQNALAAAGVALLSLVALTDGIPPLAWFALALFFTAAAGNIAMIFLLHRKRLPVPLVIFRAFLAGAGFVLLLVSIFAQPYIARLPIPTMINTG